MFVGLGEGGWEPGLGNERKARTEWLALYMEAGVGKRWGADTHTKAWCVPYHPFKGKDPLQVQMHAADLVWSF